MLLDGVGLMAVGMTTVFAFLGLLVVAMHATRLAAAALGAAPELPSSESSPQLEDDVEIAIVLAALAARGHRPSPRSS